MKSINIKIDNELLTSTIVDEERSTTLNSKQTLELLKNITLNDSKFIKLEDDTLTFLNDGYAFTINNAKEIRNISTNVDKLYSYVTITLNRIKQKEKYKENTLVNLKINSKRVLLSSTLLASSLFITGTNKQIDTITNKNEATSIENDNSKLFQIKDEVLDNIIKELDEISALNNKEMNELSNYDNINNNIEEVYLNYETLNDERMKVVENVVNKYGDTINKYSNKWGLDPRLVTAIISQESGGRETNIGQIEFDIVKNEVLNVYNFETNEYNKILFTDTVGNDPSIIYITKEDLNNPITNISCTCILLRHNLDLFNNHLMASLTAYNQGYGTVIKLIDNEVYLNNLDNRNDILNHQSDISFVNTLANIDSNNGDELYASNVMKYLLNPEEPLKIKTIKDGNVETINIRVNSSYEINKSL